jgi:hypothetical protein
MTPATSEGGGRDRRAVPRVAPQVLDLRDASGQVRAVEITAWRRRLSGWEGLATWSEAGLPRQAWVDEEWLTPPGGGDR